MTARRKTRLNSTSEAPVLPSRLTVSHNPPKNTIPITRPAPRDNRISGAAATMSALLGELRDLRLVRGRFQGQSRSLSCLIQYHAFRQPRTRPMTRHDRVHETGPGQRESSHSPSATPATAGIVTDHPTRPNMPSPNHALPRSPRRAASMRRARHPTRPVRSRPCRPARRSESVMKAFLHLAKSSQGAGLEPGQRGPRLALVIVELDKSLLYQALQRFQPVAQHCVERRYEHLVPALDQGALVDGGEPLDTGVVDEDQDPRNERGDEVDVSG